MLFAAANCYVSWMKTLVMTCSDAALPPPAAAPLRALMVTLNYKKITFARKAIHA